MKRTIFTLLLFMGIGAFFPSCQKAPELTLAGPTSMELPADGGSSSISFTANRDWTATCSESWIHVSPSSGSAADGQITVSIRCDANTTYNDRSGTVTIKAEDLTQTIAVKQPANLGIIVATREYNLTSDANSFEVEVQANVQYSVSVSSNWITQTGTKGLTKSTLVFSVAENKSYDIRNATITLKPQDGRVAEQIINVKQAQKDALIVKDSSFGMPFGGGGIEIKVETNVAFDVTPNVDWIHFVGTKALSNSTVSLTVDENPTYNAREGKVEIKQKNGSLSHTITVKEAGRIAVTSVELNKSSLRINAGDSEQIVATVKPDNATDKNVSWSSSDETIATVNESGLVTALKEGTATITAKAGEKAAECKVTVYVAVTSVELNKTSLTLIEGDAETLVATVNPENATDKNVIWSSSDVKVVTVENGKITAIKVGEAKVTAKAGEKTAECVVKVIPVPVNSVSLDHTALELEIGQIITLVATVKPDNAADKTVTWSSSNNAVSTVDAGGVVTAVEEGEAVITAKAGDKTASCVITVKRVPVTSVVLNTSSLELLVGETATLVATVSPDNATDKTISWSSSDASIVSVDANGKITALKKGDAIITAEAGEISAECKVIVKIIPVASVTLDKTSLKMKVGGTVSLTATVKPDDAADKTITWKSSDESIAAISNAGKVTALKRGKVIITAQSSQEGVFATCEVQVYDDSSEVGGGDMNYSRGEF